MLLAFSSSAQLFYSFPTNSQSSPSIKWKKIEDAHFKIIYPDYIEADADYVYSLLDHYRLIEGESYGITPPSMQFIIRPEMSQPNGFVTRGPFRSEFFASSSFNPFIGGLDWYHALAVHEYRHIVQYQALDSGGFKFFKMLFGDNGLSLLTFWTTSAWFFEGDAVWTETKYTDAGRGRSPRFMAYARALVEAGKFPTLDQLLAGSYTQPYPNHYVWGYLLITRARKIYGDEIWQMIIPKITRRGYNPFAIYTAFEVVTKKNFNEFYEETIAELVKKWPPKKVTEKEYEIDSYPIPTKDGLYYLKSTMNDLRALYLNKSGKPEKIKEINIETGLSKIDYNENRIVYTRNQPDSRYAFKGFSDVYIYNIKEDRNTRITNGKRLYHPSFGLDGKTFMAIEFTSDNKWILARYNLNGDYLGEISHQGRIYEAIYFNDQITYISADKEGYRSIYIGDKRIISRTRNNIFNLSTDGNDLIFECDLNGRVNIVRYDIKTGEFYSLTGLDEDAFEGRVFNGNLFYVKQTAFGKKVAKKTALGIKISKNKLETDYLSKDDYSDNYLQSKPVVQKIAQKQNIEHKDYGRMEDFLRPHSWSFFGGRGLMLTGIFKNYLGDNTADLSIGRNSENGKPIFGGNYFFMKYYPIFGIGGLYEDREEDFQGAKNKWAETSIVPSITLPYVDRFGFYNLKLLVTGVARAIKVTNDLNTADYELQNDRVLEKVGQFSFSLTKDKTWRRIFPVWGIDSYIKYVDADLKRGRDSRLVDIQADIYIPGIFTNAGLKMSYKRIKQEDSASAYRISLSQSLTADYKYSRGFNYFFFPNFEIYRFDYSFPVVNTELRLLGDWLYLNRITANFFYDKTKFFSKNYFVPDNKESNGLEIGLETNIMRKLPLKLMMSYIHPQGSDKRLYEFSVGSYGEF